MKLTFLGTRGYIEPRSRRHRMHTSLLVGYRSRSVRIDCGETWLGTSVSRQRRPLVVTHAHPDHVGGLADGYEGPVWATREAWDSMGDFPIRRRHVLAPRKPRGISGITFEAFTVEHSLRCPAVGYRITAGETTVFYAPDVVYIHERDEALGGVDLYVGDGASVERSLVRKRGEHLIGHTPFRTQLTWCAKAGIPRAIVTHCGSDIVNGDERRIGGELREMAEERGVEVQIARDGMEVVLR